MDREYSEKIMMERIFNERGGMPHKFWDDRENRILAVNMFFNGIPKKSEDEALIDIKDFQLKNSRLVGSLFNGYYKGNIKLMIEEVYPEKLYIMEIRKKNKSNKSLGNINYCIEIMEKASNILNIPIEDINEEDLVRIGMSPLLKDRRMEQVRKYLKRKAEM